MKVFLILSTIAVLSSCVQHQAYREHEKVTPMIVEAHGYVVPKDSFASPKTIPAGNPTVVKAGLPTIVMAGVNVRLAGTPKAVIAGIPRVCTPGQDSFSFQR